MPLVVRNTFLDVVDDEVCVNSLHRAQSDSSLPSSASSSCRDSGSHTVEPPADVALLQHEISHVIYSDSRAPKDYAKPLNSIQIHKTLYNAPTDYTQPRPTTQSPHKSRHSFGNIIQRPTNVKQRPKRLNKIDKQYQLTLFNI